jgi:hypothetical protein
MKELKNIRPLRCDRHKDQEEQMLVREGYCVRDEINGLFPGRAEPLVSKKAADVLQSHLISGYETALEQGMDPADALSLVLCWASTELVRIRLDQTREPAKF